MKQYSEFIYYCFFSPSAGIHEGNFASWQLDTIGEINYYGIAILIVAALGFFMNSRKKICRISFLWVIYSFLILCAIGWGTADNCLMLYALYFSWALYILIFMLALRLEELTGIKIFVPALLLAGFYVLAKINFPAVLELIEFASEYYPNIW